MSTNKNKGKKMPNSEIMIDRYIKALKLIKHECEKAVPIKTSHFNKDHKLHPMFFTLLKKAHIIGEVVRGSLKEGTLFEWKYNQPENELPSALANRVINMCKDYDFEHKGSNTTKKAKKSENLIDIDHGVRDTKSGKILLGMSEGEKIESNLRFLLKKYEQKLIDDEVAFLNAQVNFDRTKAFVTELKIQLGVE